MTQLFPSRRDALRTIGGAFATAVVGPSFRTDLDEARAQEPGAPEPTADQTLVDVHVHLVSSRLPRRSPLAPPPAPFDLLQQPGGAEQLGKITAQQFRESRVGHALCMPTAIVSDLDPLGIQPTLAQAALVNGPKLHAVGVAHPERFDSAHLERVEAVLQQGQVKALKAYLGYFHYTPLHPGYRPYFRLAAKYDLPIIFHTGDTYSPIAKVKFAHPLQVDEVAVDFPDTKFVLAHFGNPWILDAAQVIYKNQNVWVDLSAILIGDAAAFEVMEQEGVLERTAKRIKEGIEYSEAPQKFLFGSDWPLSSIAVYRDFVKRLFPDEQLAGVYGDNAKALFRL